MAVAAAAAQAWNKATLGLRQSQLEGSADYSTFSSKRLNLTASEFMPLAASFQESHAYRTGKDSRIVRYCEIADLT